MNDARRVATYPLRRFAWWFRTPEIRCDYRLCAAPRVGVSRWCRVHTDRILTGESTTGWPRKRRRNAL